MSTLLKPRVSWWPLAAIVLAVFMLMLDATVVTVALPGIGADLHADLPALQWVVTAYVLAMAACQLPAGLLADRYGHRRALYAGASLFAAASLACALSPGIAFLVAARAVQGAAGALLFACSLPLITTTYSGRARGIGYGVRGMASGAAVVAGPVVGGALVSALRWEWIFLVNLPVAAVCLAIAARTLPRDATGPDTIAPSAASAVSVRTALWRPAFTGAQVGAFTLQAGVFALFVYVSVYFQDVRGMSAIGAGLAFLPAVVPILIAGPVSGAILHRARPELLIAGGMSLAAAALLWMSATSVHSGWPAFAAPMALAGTGVGAALPVFSSLTMSGGGRLGLAAGITNTVQQCGGGAGVLVYGLLIAGGDVGAGLHHAFLLAAIVTAAGTCTAYALVRRG